MTKKDYIRIADALANAFHYGNVEINQKQRDLITNNLSSAFEADNPKFDSVRFREYIASKL